MRLYVIDNLNDIEKINLSNDFFYFWFPFGLGDTYIVALLKDQIEKNLNGKIVFVIQAKHNIIPEYYGIDYISITCDCRGIIQFGNMFSNIPKKGHIYGAHPSCNKMFQPFNLNGIEWYKKYFGIQDNYHIDKTKYMQNIPCDDKLRHKVFSICNDNVENVVFFIPDALSGNVKFIQQMNNLILDKYKNDTILYNSIRQYKLVNAKNIELSLDELIKICFNCKAVVSNRNGLCDVVQTINDKLTIFYDYTGYKLWSISKMYNNPLVHEIT